MPETRIPRVFFRFIELFLEKRRLMREVLFFVFEQTQKLCFSLDLSSVEREQTEAKSTETCHEHGVQSRNLGVLTKRIPRTSLSSHMS